VAGSGLAAARAVTRESAPVAVWAVAGFPAWFRGRRRSASLHGLVRRLAMHTLGKRSKACCGPRLPSAASLSMAMRLLASEGRGAYVGDGARPSDRSSSSIAPTSRGFAIAALATNLRERPT
jgi:hypothetical protein